MPVAAYVLYSVCGSLLRLAFLYEVRPAVRLSAAAALLALFAGWLGWRRLSPWLARPWPPAAAALVAVLVALGGLGQFVQWASGRTYLNVEASRAVGRLLPPDTLVHGKLANGLGLENRIRPVFVGREFGNYAGPARAGRCTIRCSATWPRGSAMRGRSSSTCSTAYPNRRIVETFAVAESPGGHDRAALFEKGRTCRRRPHRSRDPRARRPHREND